MEQRSGTISSTTVSFPHHGFNATWAKPTTSDVLATMSDLPTKTSDLTNDSGFITSTQVEPYQWIDGYAVKATTAWTIATRNSRNNGLEFPVMISTTDQGTTPRGTIERYYLQDWSLTQYDQTTYDTPIKLTWQLLQLKKKVGTLNVNVYQGYGWISDPDDEGRQYAIGCDPTYGEANPNFFYYNDGTGNLFNVTKAITLSADRKSISLGDGTTIICTRIGETWSTMTTPMANLSDLPTTTSQLTNDSGFITSADLPTKTSDLTNDSGFITSADIITKRDFTDFNIYVRPNSTTTIYVGSSACEWNESSQRWESEEAFVTPPETPQSNTYFVMAGGMGGDVELAPPQYAGVIHGDYSDIPVTCSPSDTIAKTSQIPQIPTKTSDLTNDSGFITSADIITKRALSDFNVYVDPMADMTTTKFNVVVSYAGTPSTPLFTAELTHQGGVGT